MHGDSRSTVCQMSGHGIRFFNFLFQQINSTPSQDGEQNGLMGRVDEGVDEFFSTKVTRMDSKYALFIFFS